MGKVSKRLLIVLLIGAFVIPMFVGCDNGGSEPDPVAEAKSAFFTFLKGKVADTGVATLEVTGSDLKITFKTNDSAQIKTAAENLVDAIKVKAQADKSFKIGANSYSLEAVNVVTIADDLITTLGGNSGTTTYEAHVKHNDQSFTLSGKLQFVTPD